MNLKYYIGKTFVNNAGMEWKVEKIVENQCPGPRFVLCSTNIFNPEGSPYRTTLSLTHIQQLIPLDPIDILLEEVEGNLPLGGS